MTVAYRASASIANGTASTSVVVNRPAGTQASDVLVATIAEVGVGAITAPAGWALVGLQAAGTALTYAVYTRTAAGSDPASWTWTLGSSVRAWGQISGYTGVDPSAPVLGAAATAYTTSGTVFSETTQVTVAWMGVGITTTAATRAATGTATTWAEDGIERVDVSTNGGAGTDISGTFGDFPNPFSSDYTLYQGGAQTASQTQAAAVVWVVTLNPYWPPLSTAGDLIIEVSPGADLTADPTTWTWTDISSRARGVAQIRRGQQDLASVAQPSRLVNLRLDNLDGLLTPWNPASLWYQMWGVGTPIRVSIDLGIIRSIRFQGYVDAPNPVWPSDNSDIAEVSVSASGELQRISADGSQVASPMAYQISTQAIAVGTPPYRYWTFEETSGATAASEYFGHQAIAPNGSVQWAADSSFLGSQPLPTFASGASVNAPIPTYTDTGQWKIDWAFKMPSAPVATTTVLRWTTDGADAAVWSLQVAAASIWTLKVTPTAGGADLLGDAGGDFSAAALPGQPLFFTVNTTQIGPTVHVEWQVGFAAGGNGSIDSANFTLGRVTTITFSPDAQLAGSTFGHLGFFTTADVYDVGFDQFAMWDWLALTGGDGDVAFSRIFNLCRGANVDLVQRQINTVFAGADHTMGAQSTGTLIELLQEAVDVDGGLLADGRGPGISHLGGDARYNAPVQLVLDAARRQVKRGFTPAEDDTRRRNDILATRTRGGSARFTNGTNGPLGTKQAGSRQKPITLAVETQQQLLDYASWAEHVANVPEMRAPVLTMMLRDTPELVRLWAGMDLGLRYTAANIMTQYPNRSLDLVLDYYEEDIDATIWNVRLAGSPASVYRVNTVGDPVKGRREFNGQNLVAGVSATATSWLVTTPTLPVLTTKTVFPADFPYQIQCEGEVVQVTDTTPLLFDTFTRTVANGWGTADTGQAWTTSGGSASDYAVTGSIGTQSLGSVNVARISTVVLGAADFDLVVDLDTNTALPTGADQLTFFDIRMRNGTNDFYRLGVYRKTTNTIALDLLKSVGGTGATIAGPVTVPGLTAGNSFRVRIQLSGSLLQGKVWLVAGTEPDWLISVVNTEVVGTGDMRIGSLLQAGNTNTLPVVIRYDNLPLNNPQTVTVLRSVNGVVKTHAANTPISLYQPGPLAL